MKKLKKSLSLLLALVMVLSCMSMSAFATDGWNGDGTEANPYEIATAADLKAFAAAVNAGNDFAGVTVKLTGDTYDLSGYSWTPIGDGGRGSNYTTTGNYFAGTFDGNNKTISGLTITDYGTTDHDDQSAGLFGAVKDATIKNFTIAAPSISANCNNTGAAVGFMNGGTVSGVKVNGGTVSSYEGAGGIVGRIINSGTVSGCTNSASVSATKRSAGGIVGTMYYTTNASNLEITNNINSGAVTADTYAGGIVGFSWGNITGNTNSGSVTTTGGYAGGIIGSQRHGGTISGNNNTGTVTAASKSGSIIGGIDYQAPAENTVQTAVTVVNNTYTGTGTAVGSTDTTTGVKEAYKNAVGVVITEPEEPVVEYSYLGANGYLADYFVLNFYVTSGGATTDDFTVTRSDNAPISLVTSKSAFCTSNASVYYVEQVTGETNSLGLKNLADAGCWMISVKCFTRNLDKTLTLSVNDTTVTSLSFLDYLHGMANSSDNKASAYQSLYNGLTMAVPGAQALDY